MKSGKGERAAPVLPGGEDRSRSASEVVVMRADSSVRHGASVQPGMRLACANGRRHRSPAERRGAENEGSPLDRHSRKPLRGPSEWRYTLLTKVSKDSSFLASRPYAEQRRPCKGNVVYGLFGILARIGSWAHVRKEHTVHRACRESSKCTLRVYLEEVSCSLDIPRSSIGNFGSPLWDFPESRGNRGQRLL